MRKTICFILFIFSFFFSCVSKYTVTYDVAPSSNIPLSLVDKKIGIFLFEDNRPAVEKTARMGSTVFCGDDSFEKPIVEMLNELMVKHFDANMGNKGNIVGITKRLDLP